MRKPALALALALAVAGAGAVWLGSSPDPGPVPGSLPRSPLPGTVESPPVLRRDLFRYADEPAVPLLPAVPAPAPPIPVATPTPPPIRLLGVVRVGGTLRAALSVEGETVTLAPGESLAGCRVLEISADAVRVERDGATLDLRR